jgi:hypothetical protein
MAIAKPLVVREDYLDVARANLSTAIRELISAEVFLDRADHPVKDSIRELTRSVRDCRAKLDHE